MKKLFALLLAVLMMLNLGVTGFAASGEASAETEAAEDDGIDAAITMGDAGELPEREMTENFTLDYFAGGEKTGAGISGFRFESGDPAVNFYFSELEEDKGDFYTIGGAAKNLTPADSGKDFTPRAVDFLKDLGVESFDSAILLGDDSSLGDASCEPVISAKGWTYLNVDGVLMYAEGNARSAVYSDVVGGSTIPGPGAGGNGSTQIPVVVYRNSLLETTGAAGETIDTAISVGSTGGRARGIQPQGKSITYLYDSAIVSRTWGAYSTDSARGALELVSYNSMGLSTSGYGAYADTSCRLYLYGSQVLGASDGIVASNNGEIYAVASDCDKDGTALRGIMEMTGEAPVSPADYGADDGIVQESVIAGGNTAVQFHMPDQGHSGAKNTKKAVLYMQGGTLATLDELVSGENSAYNERYAGACIVTKSTQGKVLLDGVDMQSRTGVLVHCMINSDSNVNNIADGDIAPGSDFTFKDMTVSGDIVHDDYQRALRLTLDGTELTGAIFSNTCEDWNAFCTEKLDGEYILNPDGYETFWGVELTLENGAVWNVTETSVLASLDAADGIVNGTVTENPDGTVTVEPLAGEEFADSYPLQLSVNGQTVLDTEVAGEIANGEFRFDLGALLNALGLAADYDEADGNIRLVG